MNLLHTSEFSSKQSVMKIVNPIGIYNVYKSAHINFVFLPFKVGFST